VIPCKDEVKGGKENKTHDQLRAKYKAALVQPLKPAMIKRAEEFWNESLKMAPDRDRRFFPFYGQDEYSGSKSLSLLFHIYSSLTCVLHLLVCQQ
jgi:hypothetical protein